jgi:hypothetical protein
VAGCFDTVFNGQPATTGIDTFVMKISPHGESLWTPTADGNYEQDRKPFQTTTDDAGKSFVSADADRADRTLRAMSSSAGTLLRCSNSDASHGGGSGVAIDGRPPRLGIDERH